MMHLTRLLKIQPDDIPHLSRLAVLNLLLVSLHSFGASIVTSLFIKRFGVDYLPRMYLISPLAIVACTLLVLRLGNIKRNDLLTYSCALFGAIVAAGAVLLRLGIAAACPVLYVLGDLVYLFFYTQFWALAVETCDVREGKRIFTYVVCAGLIGGGLAGAGVNLLASRFGTDDLLVLWAALFFAVALYMRRNVPEPAAPREAGAPFAGQLRDTAACFARSGHVRVLMACVVLAAVSGVFVDFVFNKIMDRTFTGEAQLTAFYGAYSVFFYAGTLVIQLFVTNRIVRSLGTGNTLLLLPASVTLGFGSLVAAFGYYTGVATRYLKDVIGSSFSDSTYPLMFSPVRENVRNSIIAIGEGIVTPLGTACAGGILMLVAGGPDIVIAGTSAAFAALWVFFGFRLKNSYRAAFVGNLAEKSLPDLTSIEDMGNMSEGQALELLSHALRSKDDAVSRFAMRTLARSGGAAEDLLARYLEEDPPNGRKADLLYFLGSSGKCPAAAQRCLADPDPLVRAKAVGAFLSSSDARIPALISPFVHDADPRVRVNAVMVLGKSGMRQEYLEVLSAAAADPSEETRCWAGFALRQLDAAEGLPLLLALSKDVSPKVRAEAVKGLSRSGSEEAGLRLLEMLDDADRKIRRAAYRSLVEKEGSSALLMRAYETCGGRARQPIVTILAARREGEGTVFRHLEDELRALYKRIAWMAALRREKQTPPIELFIATLANRNRRDLDALLKVCSDVEGSTAFGLIVKRLKDKDPRSFAEALELLDTMTLHKRSFLKSVVSLLEGMPENELAAYAYTELGIREYTAGEIYAECLQGPADSWFKRCAHAITDPEGLC